MHVSCVFTCNPLSFLDVSKLLLDTGFGPAESKNARADVETAVLEVQGAVYYDFSTMKNS